MVVEKVIRSNYFKIIIAIILLSILLKMSGDSVWFFEPPNMGDRSTSFKMEGTVPVTRNNFGGFYKGFPSKVDSNTLKGSNDW